MECERGGRDGFHHHHNNNRRTKNDEAEDVRLLRRSVTSTFLIYALTTYLFVYLNFFGIKTADDGASINRNQSLNNQYFPLAV